MKKQLLINIGLLLFFICLLNACDPPEGKTKIEVIEERINYRLENWLFTYHKKCRERVLETAAEIVDSTLIANARRQIDALNRPDRPLKPDNPNFIAPKDTTPIAPLISLDSLFYLDSLYRLDSLGILEDSIH